MEPGGAAANSQWNTGKAACEGESGPVRAAPASFSHRHPAGPLHTVLPASPVSGKPERPPAVALFDLVAAALQSVD